MLPLTSSPVAPVTSLYSSPNSSTSKHSLRRTNSPTRQSQQPSTLSQQQSSSSYKTQQHVDHAYEQQQQQHQQQQQQHQHQQQQQQQQQQQRYHNHHYHRQQQQESSQQKSVFSQPTNQEVETQKVMFLSEPFVRTALVKGSFKTIVQLPKYVDAGEWVALNVFEFFTNLNQFYGVIAEYVTPDAYPTMNAGPHTDYLWLDANNRQVSLPASQYIDLALTWINNKVNDKNLFPTSSGVSFPQAFQRDIQRIMIQMFRIFAHIYHHHFDKIIHLSLEAHWNSFFAHFISFAKEFNIIERKEVYPLMSLIENLETQGKII